MDKIDVSDVPRGCPDDYPVYTVRVVREDAGVFDDPVLLGDATVAAIEFSVALRPSELELPCASTFVGLAEERAAVAARRAMAAVRDAGWPAGRYVVVVDDRVARLEYLGDVIHGEPVEVAPRPPF